MPFPRHWLRRWTACFTTPPPPALTPAFCLRFQQDKAVVEDSLCSPYWGGERTVPTSFEPWKMFWRLMCSAMLWSQGFIRPFHFYRFCCSSAHSLLFHWALMTRMMLYMPWGLSGAQGAAVRGKGWRNAEFSLTHLHCPSGSDGCTPACSGTVFCSSCPVQCTFPLMQTSDCIVPYILANQWQIFYSVFIHLVNRKMDYSESCYLQTLLGFPWGKEEYFYSSRQSFQEKKKKKTFPSSKSLWGSKSFICSG